jgi:uncharacterized protein
MKQRQPWALTPRTRLSRLKYGGLTTLGLERASDVTEISTRIPPQTSRRLERRGLTTLSLSSRRAAAESGAQTRDQNPAPRVPRLWRRQLTTLSLNGREPSLPPSLFSPEPPVTEMDIWLRRLDASHDGLRIVHLSDIHHSIYTPLEDVGRVVYLANQLRPDVVVLTGDYVTLATDCIWPVARALGRLQARLGVFAVLGNHDFQVDADQMTRALQAHGVDVLRNSHRVLLDGFDPQHACPGSRTLWIAGVDDLWWRADNLDAAIRSISPQDPKILLCHNPLGIHQAAAHGIDFVLSGHTHGGQVRLPVVRSLYRSKLGERFVDGWNRLDDTQIYVNRGIGKVLLPFRVDCPPEIACFRLRSARRQVGEAS